MKKNVGSADQIIRWIIGIVIAALGIYYKNWWGLVAVIPIGTALFNFCPIWWATGISTRKKAA